MNTVVTRLLRRNRAGRLGVLIVAAIMLIAEFGPLLAPYGPLSPDYPAARQAPTLGHLGGTDDFGRDILSRTLYGARISLGVGFAGVLLGLIPGVAAGLTAGYYSGGIDAFVMRVVDVMLAFPGILLAIAMVAILGAGIQNVVIAIGIFGFPVYTRIVRGSTLQATGQTYVEAAHAEGARPWRILMQHILPNIFAPIIVISSLQIANAILTEAALSFLGLGAPPPTPEWGAILSGAENDLVTSPYMAVLPGAALVITILGFNLLGDGLRDALDPRMRV
ncbi:MAG TPA: ABC transporter permease [bacterium]|nr:ABC transporter permease [bacterium]